MTTNEIVSLIRKELVKRNLDGFIDFGSDPHLSEYIAPYFRVRRFITGFSGSNGIVLITKDKAQVWTDSRYFIQCKNEIANSCFEICKINKSNDFVNYVKENFSSLKLGVWDLTTSYKTFEKFKENGISLIPTSDIVKDIWKKRDDLVFGSIYPLSKKYTGEDSSSKIERIKKTCNTPFILLTKLDEIAWTLNMRGSDIIHTPVFLSFLLIGPSKTVFYTNAKYKIANIEIKPYNCIYSDISEIKEEILCDDSSLNLCLAQKIKKPVFKSTPVELFKACKNKTEVNNIKYAHLIDGIAVCDAIAALKSKKYKFSELSFSDALEDLRSDNEDFVDLSFGTICAFKEHGAIVHYKSSPETDTDLTGNGLLVLDSGAQYKYGTTDITRTILIGKATKQQKRDYTLVLKGHLALSRQIFPEGTTGGNLDAIAKQFMWKENINFLHGTGHGVGYFLSVHEGPCSISPINNIPLKVGMILSNEPGIYRENSHGIRIENLISVVQNKKNEFGSFLSFENLTLCPYEKDLIEKSLLTSEEIEQINFYHQWVYENLKDYVKKSSLSYLKKATEAL